MKQCCVCGKDCHPRSNFLKQSSNITCSEQCHKQNRMHRQRVRRLLAQMKEKLKTYPIAYVKKQFDTHWYGNEAVRRDAFKDLDKHHQSQEHLKPTRPSRHQKDLASKMPLSC